MIFNDEVGLGKRLQAIAAAIYYQNEWPLLICCPATMLQLWREEFIKWIPNFDLTKMSIIVDSNQEINNSAITVISYQALLTPQIFDKIK